MRPAIFPVNKVAIVAAINALKPNSDKSFCLFGAIEPMPPR